MNKTRIICLITSLLLSLTIIGVPLNDAVAHRVEHVMKVTGLNEGDEIKPEHIARLLVSSEGALKNTENKKVIPLINMVDDNELEGYLVNNKTK